MRLIRLLKQDLAKEVDDWLADDLIDESQRDRILARYGITPGESQPLGYTMLMGLGMLFVGLALITLIGANWQDIPRYVRTLGLISLTTATHLSGWFYLKRGDESKALGLIFLGNLFYGASIILIAQIFHLGEHMPDGVYFWALGCLPMALLTGSRLIALQMLALAFIWLFMEANLGFLPVTFPLFLAAALYVLSVRASVTLFLAVVSGTFLWLEYLAAWFWSTGWRLSFSEEHLVLTASLFALAYSAAHWLIQRQEVALQDYGAILAAWCLRFVLVLMLVLSFAPPWEELLRADWYHWSSLLIISTLIWAAALYLGYQAKHYGSLLAFAALLILSAAGLALLNGAVHAPLFQATYNLVIIGLGIWLIIQGVQQRIGHYFWSGIVAILAVALFRYFDLIGSYIGGSLLFLTIAGILLGAARYWRALEHGNE
ncbi:MAG: DUF2157 domain-containing protein [Pseudomonadales bacterium]